MGASKPFSLARPAALPPLCAILDRPGGELLGTYNQCSVAGTVFLCDARLRVYFGGRLILNGGAGVKPDRLGSPDGTHGRVYLSGEVAGSATTDQEETFTTYTRDGYTGLDYAKNRYYAYSWGRFLTADPYRASGGAANPGSWNRSAYVENEPVNLEDPNGLQAAGPIFYCEYIEGSGCITRIVMPYEPGSAPVGPAPAPEPAESLPPCPPMAALPPTIGRDQIQKNIQEAKGFYTAALAIDPERAMFALFGFFVAKLAPGGDWDYKKVFDDEKDHENHEIAKVFGNFNFGAVLQSFDFTYKFSQSAAGIAQILICGAGGDCGTGIPGLEYPFGDQVADAVTIKKGFDFESAKRSGCKEVPQ